VWRDLRTNQVISNPRRAQGILAPNELTPFDPDNPPLDEKFWARAKPMSDERLARYRGMRGPQRAPTKTATSIRLDADVVAHFKAGGPGWQSRINAALRKAAGLK